MRVVEGAVPAGEIDRGALDSSQIRDGWRLACQVVLDAETVIEIPSVARSAAGKSFGGEIDLAGAPRVFELMTTQETEGESTVVRADGEIVAVRPGRTACLGLAVDIGSTSLAGALIDLATGEVRASAARLNPQVAFGADVISRIHFAREQADGPARLTSAVRAGLAAITDELLGSQHVGPDDVVAAAVAGNPTMMHTWAGANPSPLGVAPYLGAWTAEMERRAAEVGLPIHRAARVWAFPMIRSHVGADAVAAALACDLDRAEQPTLLVDLGTNSEVVVAARGHLVAASAAAGPAFEGATIRCGMRAAPGAIDAVGIVAGRHLVVNTIGGLPARGICGSGLIDAVAALRTADLIDETGLLALANRGRHPASLARRVTEVDGQRAFVLVPAAETAAGEDLVLTAPDVRQLQLAKGSILAAIRILCETVGIGLLGLGEVLIAGAFGTYVRKASALAIGLVPPIDPERVRFVGNAAGVGARLALVDNRIRRRARALAAATEYVELASHADYQTIFMESLAFPPSGRLEPR